jgi:hypothetical protein
MAVVTSAWKNNNSPLRASVVRVSKSSATPPSPIAVILLTKLLVLAD